ncbi:MAG: 5-bromo-4-chloroindolyl phosphate hydrolysis family protein [Rubrimonas sp.]|uniref:5-bromo-4-chloroindolyl phosphate hydrolysis family protein n=1 Tax=Rubrimonas sp. TaxID=2036015 RepID=UPI002FDD09D9
MSAGRRWGGAHSPGDGRGEEGPAARAARAARVAGAPPPSPQLPRPKPASRKPAPSQWSGRAVRSRSLRATLLFLWPTFLLFGAFAAMLEGDALGLVWMGGAWVALILAAGLTRTGIEAAAAYEARAVAKPPAFPRKLFGAAFTALGVGVATWFGGLDMVRTVVFAAVAGGLHVAAFGIDPMKAKGVDGLEGAALDEAITKIETARALLGEMTGAIARTADRALQDRVAALAASAQEVLARIERDPRDLRRARRFLSVYLVGARDAAVKFARAWEESPDPLMRADYVALLDDLEGHFARHREELLLDDRTALDVEIEVLRDRLKMEGV